MSEKQELDKVLWSISNDLRGNMDASRFKDYILGLIFYRFLSHNIEELISGLEEGKTAIEMFNEEPEAVKEESLEILGYFIEPTKLFNSFVQKYQAGENIIEELSNTLNQIEASTYGKQSQGDFQGLFADLNLTSQDLGIDATAKNKTVGEILVKLADVDFQFNNSEIDVLGDAYEYMISMFASEAGKKAGEFYTPQSVAKLLTKIISSEKEDIKKVYDPTCGSGSLLLRVAREFNIEKMFIYGEELNTSTYNLARMNMLIHKVKYDRFTINNTNTLENPTFTEQKFDAVVANPPFSANWSAAAHLAEDVRFSSYGKMAPKTKADFAFVQHMLHQINETGIVATVLPHGPLFRGAAEKVIREQMLNNNQIDTIIGLPQNIFFGTGIPTIILVLKKNKDDDKVLFIDASKEFTKVKTQNILEEKHLEKIIKTYQERKDLVTNDNQTEYSKLVSLEEIKANDYNLNIPRYVDTFEPEPEIDLDEVNNNLLKIEQEIKAKELEVEEMLKELVETIEDKK